MNALSGIAYFIALWFVIGGAVLAVIHFMPDEVWPVLFIAFFAAAILIPLFIGFMSMLGDPMGEQLRRRSIKNDDIYR